MARVLEKAALLFPLWVIIGVTITWIFPTALVWFKGPWITYSLGLTMLGMGISLRTEDFTRVFQAPKPILIGVIGQYTIMPLTGWVLGNFFQLPTPLAIGIIVVSCCPGGVASNVISFLARGDLALSVTMTAISTVLSVVMTPLLTLFLAGNSVGANALGLFLDTIQVVILPVILGILLNRYTPRFAEKVKIISPLVAVLLITLIVASIIGSGKEAVIRSGLHLIFCVFLLHISGYFFGYWVAFLGTRSFIVARTVSIEVGMQNSGLGAVLARNNFSDPLVAIPAAISSLVHSLIGSVLAGIWRRSIPGGFEEKTQLQSDLP
ncbi:bile acid:sodium symporter family protein [Leptospira langatensis]|uniref:Bile acid:sodium symporter family protein n=1 Tax=Leptospira langatensis TaxID=2484983 RepID=A0A5F1ZSJ5_9LEPT|nr:bile acid:sodium symporter family protein [Leptospira langatensis]TGK01880.1 bile acid:sodium symporter family protein [Leptospira langatensis]TGL39485.1 bile acid:sodium symporter family protein [Leptospira langatensis]